MLQRVSTSAGKKAFLKTTLLRRIATAYRTGRATVDPPQPISDRPSYKTKDGAIFSPRRKPPRVQSQREQVDRKRQWTMQGGKAYRLSVTRRRLEKNAQAYGCSVRLRTATNQKCPSANCLDRQLNLESCVWRTDSTRLGEK